MIELINSCGTFWTQYVLLGSIQNSLYLLIIFGIIHFIRHTDIRILRYLLLLGAIKTLIPPILTNTVTIDVIPMIEAPLISISGADNVALQSPQWSPAAILMLCWSAILVVIFAVIGLNLSRLQRISRSSTKLDLSDFNFGREIEKVIVLKSESNLSPVVFGLFRYKIIVPADWDNWPLAYQRTVIVHELNHIRNKDPQINLLKSVLLAMHFFNPLIWILLKKLDQYSENLCDDSTIDDLRTNQSEYLKDLISISESLYSSRQNSLAAISFSESYYSIKRRITYQMKKKEDYHMKSFSKLSKIILVIMTIGMIPFLWQCEKEDPGEMLQSEFEPSAEVYSIKDVHERPEVVDFVKPEYPKAAKEKGIEGFVMIAFIVNENGDVTQANVMRSVPGLDEVALEAAKACKFKPAMINGAPVKVKWQLPFEFDLDFANPEIAHGANLYQYFEASVKPEMLHKEVPKYPEEARKDKIEGKTVITLTINESGSVEKAKVYVSSHPILDDAALTAAKKCKFKPAELDGKPIKVKMNVPYSFKLK